jgi:glycosyltransferase involved in cell wall biosynthesis
MVTISGSTKLWAFAMAEQFEKHGMLDELITTYAYSKNTIARRFIKRIDKEEIPLDKIRTNILLAIPIGMFRQVPYIWNEYFDRWAARQLKPGKSRVFIGWSGMSLHSLRRAKQLGMITVLERGSSHIEIQNEILKEEYARFGKHFSIHPSVVKKELQEYEEADYIAVPSTFVKDSFIKQGMPEQKIFLNPYGANRSFIRKPQTDRTSKEKFRIVYMGTLSIRKGLVYLFQALALLNIPESAFEVLFLGTVDSELKGTIAKHKKNNWHFLGHVDYYSLPDYLTICDIGVQPSLEEGLSMVIPQMMACGVPVIITPNTGGQNIIQSDDNGFVVPVRDPMAIAEKLDWAFHHPDQLTEMKHKAAESISNEFTWDAYGNRYTNFLKSIVPEKKPHTSNKTLLVAIYSHPEYYPPTLSALENLSALYKDIYVLHRNLHGFNWKYPSNVYLIGPEKQFTPREVERAGVMRKMGWYLAYSRELLRTMRKYKPDTLLIYDFLAILAYRMIDSLAPDPRITWYHNHDVAEEQYIKKNTISWLSWKSEKWLFPKLQIFSLPSVERKRCFPMELLKGRFIFLPNFPSALIYQKNDQVNRFADPVYRILFQGSIGPLHGLEEIIALLKEKITGKDLVLVLKGFISPEYLGQLKSIADFHKVSDKLIYIGPTDYRQVIENGKTCHIGIGIHKKNDIMNQTLGTASNKIYEYAALGLPVILYDNAHFREILGRFAWAFFTDTSQSSLKQCLEDIILNYSSLSNQAAADFCRQLSFEHYFISVKDLLEEGEISSPNNN